ncbi:hypothetical protein [Bowmanella denitrificans]|uniref:hypothetical protein n=1 Tax=Bowmanella denitrificans TaxID=366582 RepID=UPI000C99D42E|nr:hypothetical protein [Bowmanella denitrificans]
MFVLIQKNEELMPDEYLGEIYYVSGDVAYKGKMKIVPADSELIDYLNPDSYQGWDGDTLYVAGIKQLKVQK